MSGILFCLLASLLLQAQPPAKPAEPRPHLVLPKPLMELADLARSVPAEFGADALLRLAESPAVTDLDTRRELIDEAFRLAAAAQEPMKRRGIRQGSPDTRVNFQSRAFAQDLDVLSLQSRAVLDMISLDHARARLLFDQITPPRPPKLACADALVYDVAAFYETLAEIVSTTFTPKERAEEQHVKYLMSAAGRILSPVEVGPMARALMAVKVTPEQLQAEITAFGASLRNIAGDDRTFSFTVSRFGTALTDLGALATEAGRQQVPTVALLEAFRGYLVRHLTGARCWDTGGPTITTGIVSALPAGQPDALTFFNDQLRPLVYPPAAQIEPLGPDDIRAASAEGAVDEEKSWNSQEVKLLADRYNLLLKNPNGVAWSADERNSNEWKDKLREFLGAMAAWKPEVGAAAANYFYQKCYLFSSLVNLVPNGDLRQQVLRGYLQFLEQNSFRESSRIQWFLPVNTLLVRVMFDPALSPLADEMRHAADAVIALYARLDTLIPRSPAKVMPLL
jgi:hypothetical protein